MTEPAPTEDNRAARAEAARGRIEFWAIWANEAQTATARTYFKKRLNHWEHVLKSIDLELA